MLPQKGTGLLWSSWGGCFGRCPSPWNDSRVQNLPCEYIFFEFSQSMGPTAQANEFVKKTVKSSMKKAEDKESLLLEENHAITLHKEERSNSIRIASRMIFFFFFAKIEFLPTVPVRGSKMLSLPQEERTLAASLLKTLLIRSIRRERSFFKKELVAKSLPFPKHDDWSKIHMMMSLIVRWRLRKLRRRHPKLCLT